MPASVVLHLTTRPGLAGGLVDVYLAEAARRPSDELALLVSTQLAAESARRLLLAGGAGGLLDARLMTFPQLAETLLVANHHTSRELTALQRELLVADVLADLRADGALGYLAPTSDLPGTVRAMCELLDEIKRGGVSSEDFPGHISRLVPGHPANGAVATVYARYQTRLQALELYDEPGLFWNALELLRQGARQPLGALKVLLLDGFEEFTTTQLRMLQALTEFVERVEVRLWLDETRSGMTPRTLATVEQLQRELGAEVRREAAPAHTPLSNLDHVRQALFSPLDAKLEAADGSVQVLEAAGGIVGECREIARQIKLLLTGDSALRPNQIAVVLRSWDSGHDVVLRQAFARYGLPVDFTRGPALASVPVVQSALDLLDLVENGWLRADVIKLLNSSYVTSVPGCDDPPSARRLEQLALEAGIIGGGAEAWREGLARLRDRLQEQRRQREHLEREQGLDSGDEELLHVLEDEDGNRYPTLAALEEARRQVERGQLLVDAMDKLVHPLAQAGSLAAAARALGSLIEALGLPQAAAQGSPERVAEDLQALSLLADLLREIAESPDLLGIEASAEASLFVSQVRQACTATRLRAGRRRQLGVQVLDVSQAGFEPFEIVFICGLRDGQFPARRRQDVFYSDAERAGLQESLPGLRPRLGGHHDDEALLYAALSAARRQVWLTYPLTEANGGPVLRSLYVDEVLRHWQTPGRPELPAQLVHSRRQSEVIVGAERACNYAEVLESLQAGKAALPACGETLTPPGGGPTLAQVEALAALERHRSREPQSGPFAGVLSEPELMSGLAARYGPGHIFSVSQLNAYARCPMQFFLNRVLGLEETVEPAEGLDRRDLGTLAHRILARFFGDRAIGQDQCAPLTSDRLDEARETLAARMDEICNSWVQTVFGAQQVWDRAIDRLRADLSALLGEEARHNEEERGRKTLWSPPRQVRAVEATFGKGGSFAIETRLPEPVRIRGRIDRLDRTEEGGTVYWVIWDYKTGNGVTRRLVEEGTDLQLPLYAMAVDKLYPNEAGGHYLWGYCRVERPVGWTNALVRRADEQGAGSLGEVMATAQGKVADYVEGIRAGRFPALPNETAGPCRYCDFRGICRV